MSDNPDNQLPEEYQSPAALLASLKQSQSETVTSVQATPAVPVAPEMQQTPPPPVVAPPVPKPVDPQTSVMRQEEAATADDNADNSELNDNDIPDDYFLVYPENESIVRGESRSLPPLGARLVFIAGLPFLAAGIVLVVYTSMRWQAIVPLVRAGTTTPPDTILNGTLWTLATFFFNVLVIGLYLSGFSLATKRRSLEKHGQVIWGEVVTASGEQDRAGNTTITLAYKFRQPRGWRKRYLNDKVREQRPDLKGKALPVPGTPVAVLFLNRQNYEIL